MTALDLPALGLGTSGNDDPEECAATVARALDAGYRHVDTAQMYDNEAAVGDGLARSDVPREEVVVATKVHPDSLAPADVRETTRASLDRLGLDAVDMLYVHWPTAAYDAETTLPAFDDLHREDLTDHVCVSNFTPALLDEARELLDANIAAHQVECHPLLPQYELRAHAEEHDHYLVAYSPLGRGELLDHPVLTEVAEAHDTTVPAVCLSYLASLDRVVPIPKATGAHVEANLAAADLDLAEDAVARIEGIDQRSRFVDPDAAAWN
ncbi:MAG: aldo/keto reductase [Halolamina sp.]